MFLMLTELCPNRCEYCYIKDRANPKTISTETIEKVIKEYNPMRVVLFGGEPLADLDLFKYVVKKYYGKIRLQVVTSTSINFKEFIEFYKSYPIELQLSWDGFNKNRLNAGGHDTSHKTYENILYAMDSGIKGFDVKSVISNDNANQLLDLHHLFLEWEKKDVHGQFVIAHRDLYTPYFYEAIKTNLIKTFTLDKIYTDHLNKIIAYLNQDTNYSSCDGGNYIVIDPDGRNSYCTALSQEKNLNISATELKLPCKDPDCQKCHYRYLCDGGCRYERYNEYGKDWLYHKLDSTCKMMQIYEETIQTWLGSLTFEETQKLKRMIFRYQKWAREFNTPL